MTFQIFWTFEFQCFEVVSCTGVSQFNIAMAELSHSCGVLIRTKFSGLLAACECRETCAA